MSSVPALECCCCLSVGTREGQDHTFEGMRGKSALQEILFDIHPSNCCFSNGLKQALVGLIPLGRTPGRISQREQHDHNVDQLRRNV
jgi:hypothetical protein